MPSEVILRVLEGRLIFWDQPFDLMGLGIHVPQCSSSVVYIIMHFFIAPDKLHVGVFTQFME